MILSRDDVKHIADLAHLALSDAMLETYQQQLSAILEYAASLQQLDTDSIPPTASVLPLHTVLRDDEPVASLPSDQALHNAPESYADCFLVPPLR